MKLHQLMRGKTLWIGFVLLAVAMMATALYHQYVLDELPCVLCIQFRLLVIVFALISIVGLIIRKSKIGLITSSLLLLFVFSTMLERSYQLLGTERGFIDGECSMDMGLPAWFAIDQWMPSIFEAMITCGYTPVVGFGITMAEALLAMSIALVLLSVAMLVSAIRH